tara:strand:- start:52 stop:249 length:198 start_codon:yes stop_codon:yes gene_type:complete
MKFKADKFILTKKSEYKSLGSISQIFFFAGLALIILSLITIAKSLFPLLSMIFLLAFIRKEASSK